MANLRTELYYDHHNRCITRLGHESMDANIHTWNTFVKVLLLKDGSGAVTIEQNGKIINRIVIKPESEKPKEKQWNIP